MKYIVPTRITDAMLVSSSVPETEHAAWSAGTAYAVGARCIYAHSIYERVTAGTTSTAPDADPANWARISPTNRWACLDSAVGTTTRAANSITLTLQPGVVRGLALLDLSADSVTVTMTVAGATVYSRTLTAVDLALDVDNWLDFFTASFERRSVLTFTDLPPYGAGVITVTLTGGGTVSLGTCAVGAVHELGDVLSGAQVGITDYSVKTRDDYGAVTLTERGYNMRVVLPLLLKTPLLDVVTRRLAAVRATPAIWIGSGRYSSLVIYGLCRDWSVSIPGRQVSTCSLEIDGLV